MILRSLVKAVCIAVMAASILTTWSCIALTANAQGVLFGSVVDDNAERLPGVNVFIDGTGLGAATDLDGTYRITGVPAGQHVLTASAIGYEQVDREVAVEDGGEVRVDFVLAETSILAGEVVVTASRREQLSSRVAASVSSLSPQDIQDRNSVSLDDALQHVSGVQMAGNQVNIRGSSGFSYNTGSRVLLLVDGLPMLRPDADGIPFDALPMNQVDRIEVLKGPGSALYGGGALGGVVNVITKEFPERPSTSLDVYGGFYDPVRYDLWRSRWDGGDELRPMGGISAGHSRRFGGGGGMWISLSYRGDAGHLRLDESRQLQAYSKIGLPVGPSTRLSFLTGVTRRKSDNFLFWNGLRDALNPGEVDFGRPDPGSGSNDNLVNELSFLPSFTHLVGQHFYYAVRGRLFGVLIQPLDEAGDPRPLSSGTVGFRYGGEVQLNYAPRETRHITAGITGDANATRSSFFEDENESLSQPEGALFAQWEETISERLDIAAGLRFDVYRIRAGVVEQKLSPKLSASYLLSDAFVLRAAYGEGFRVPSVAERFISNSDYLPIVTNLDVRPEISRSYEIGLRASPTLFAWPVALDGALFWNNYRRLVEPTFIAQERAFQFINITEARIRGAEVTFDASAPRLPLRLHAGYTFLDARDLEADEPLVFRSEHLLKAGGTLELWQIELGVDARLASRPERVDSDFALFVPDADRMVPTRVVDLRIGSTWYGVRATLHVKNAFDYYYLERPALLAPQRHVMLQMSTTF